ncbi:aldolase/citrate lyase family protein [Pseudomonas sp. RIT-PI-S]|uniref:HpcH/HpaI aldolase family protein n=1 Tax=Pseudomonas sp. RIT-PI-S TaxID=3035295 RepID=UPI0021D9D78E|nr:aldolase/citrate lyase family protein [Pseudomonas sp. RIT-PI-S]
MFEKNRLLAMLERKQVPLGMQCFTGNPALIEVLGCTGFDFVMLDTEHAGNDPHAMEDLVRVSQHAGLVPFVRVPDRHDEGAIRRALEAGASGVFLPMVRTVEDVRFAANSAFFPPQGTRGICPATRAAGYAFNGFERYTEWSNAESLLIPMIEHPEGVQNIDAICAMEEVKVIVFGAGDLAYAMNEGTLMMKSPKVQEAYRIVLTAAKRHGVAVIGGPVLDPSPEACRKSLEDGISVFCLGLDILGFRRFCEQTVSALNTAIDDSGWQRPAAPPSGFHG